MKAAKDKVVAISYELIVDGKLADKADASKPLDYIHGTGMLLPKFEAELEGKEPGEDFTFTLSPADGYGEYNPNYAFDIPKDSFIVDGQLREDLLLPGTVIPMLNSSGQVVQGTVLSVGEDSVKMDFNHPMAGKTLNFSGKVLSVRDATEKELTEGLHGEYLPAEGCGGGCKHGECGGSCKHGECGGEGCGHGEDEGCGHGECGCKHKN